MIRVNGKHISSAAPPPASLQPCALLIQLVRAVVVQTKNPRGIDFSVFFITQTVDQQVLPILS